MFPLFEWFPTGLARGPVYHGYLRLETNNLYLTELLLCTLLPFDSPLITLKTIQGMVIVLPHIDKEIQT